MSARLLSRELELDFGLRLREDFLLVLLARLTPDCELADNVTNVLVPIIAFDGRIILT
jgi:hypothetical protein